MEKVKKKMLRPISKEYVYNIETSNNDVKFYEIKSNVKLTHDEVKDIYFDLPCDSKIDEHSNLSKNVDWSNERFTNDEILNKIKISIACLGTEYGDDTRVDITGEFEND